jgi:hypothetical protein
MTPKQSAGWVGTVLLLASAAVLGLPLSIVILPLLARFGGGYTIGLIMDLKAILIIAADTIAGFCGVIYSVQLIRRSRQP